MIVFAILKFGIVTLCLKMLQPHYNIIIVYKLTGGPGGPAGPCGPTGPLNHKKDRFKRQ